MEPVNRLSVNTPTPFRSLGNVPSDILFEIFTYFNPPQLCSMRLVCKKWREIADHRLIWKQLFRKQFPLAYSSLNPNLNFLEVYCSVQKRIKVSSQIRFNKFRVEEERKISHPRFKWPWVFGSNGRVMVLWNVETKKTHILQLQTFLNAERPFLQPLALKKGCMYVIASHRIGDEGCTLHEVDIAKGTINRSYRPPASMGRFLHFKKRALYFAVHHVVHVWRLQDQINHVLIEKKARITVMIVRGDYIALVVQDNTIDVHHRVTGVLLHSLASIGRIITLGKHVNFGVLLFTLNQAAQVIEAREAGQMRLVTTYPFRVVAQGFNQSELSEVAVDEDFLVVKMIHVQNPPLAGATERQTTLEFFDIESGCSISVIKLDKEPFGLFFKNGKIFYQVKELVAGKEKIKTEWVDFNNENYSKREGCVIS